MVLRDFIEEINDLSYEDKCQYVENKLILLDLYEIQHFVFFKKLHILLTQLHSYLCEFSGTDGNGTCIYKFCPEVFDNNDYFYETRGFILLKHIKLSKNTYHISIPVKKFEISIHTYIDITKKEVKLLLFIKN